MLLSDGYQSYLEFITYERMLSEKTVASYQRAINQFLSYLKKQNIINCDQVSVFWVRRYLAEMHYSKLKSRSIAQKISSLRNWFQFLAQKNIVPANPFNGIKTPKLEKHLPKTLEVDEINVLLDKMPSDDFLSCRDKTIMELFYSSGIRLSELQAVQFNDLSISDSSIRVTGKGSKTRIVPIGSKALKLIKKWLTFRKSYTDEDETALFITESGLPLKHRSIQSRIAEWGIKLGATSRLHPHKFRHSCASHFLESSSDLRAVQELLGHADLSTTQIYTHLDFQHLARVYDSAHPRAKKKDE
ncbi:tyrosine recombinase XerC [Pleionea sediminis]|uniref:tyrosine recombinase XerC n=1 Tax=Pleionea sediminis TaxID=2569479 RepID=UPI001184E96A|nr:tyrosine recombinase XerC [Pleionea sediminis]